MAQISFAGSIGVPGSAAVLGSASVVFASDANHTLLATEYSNKFLAVSGTISTTRALLAPINQGQEFVVQNNTTGGHSITITPVSGSGSSVTITNGSTVSVVCDGTNYLAESSGGTVTLSGDVTGANTATTVTALQGHAVSTTAPTTNYVLTWNGSAWTPEATGTSFTAAGDLSGSATSQTVIGLQGHSVSSTAPTSNYVLTWNGSAWTPAAIPTQFTAGGDLSGTSTDQTVIALQGHAVSSTAPTTNYVLTWNGSAWAPATTQTTFTAAGDLSGSSTSQTVTGLQGHPVSSTAPTTNYVLEWNGSAWAPTALPSSLPPNGSAGGDLSSSYPNPTVAKLQGNAVESGTLGSAQDGYILAWKNSASQWQPLQNSQDVTSSTSTGELVNSVVQITGPAADATLPILTASSTWTPAGISNFFVSETPYSVQTTNATATTIATIATSSGYSYRVDALLMTLQAADGYSDVLSNTHAGLFSNVSGTLSQQGATLNGIALGTTTGLTWTGLTMTTSGTNILVKVTGAAATTINWRVQIRLTVTT